MPHEIIEIRKVNTGGIEISFEEFRGVSQRRFLRSVVIPKERFAELIHMMDAKDFEREAD